jgi:hypothetical protein
MTQPAPRGDPSRPATAEHDPSPAAERDASRRPRSAHDASDLAAAEHDASRADTVEALRVCAWCRGPIPPAARRDAVCCSVRCRQARHRFTRAAAGAPGDPSRPTGAARRLHRVPGGPSRPEAVAGPLRLAYADPPYPGKAHLYRGHPDYAGEVDHAALIRRLSTYDGWALSTSAAALPAVLALCPPGVRVAAWHRGERPARSRWPLNAWEPVIYHGGRPADPSRPDALQTRRVDSLVCGVSALTTLPSRVTGTKPAAFCRWVFGLLGAEPGDTLDDLFPGSGAVTRAWAVYTGAPDPSRPARAGRVAPVGDENDASPEVLHDASRADPRDVSCPTSAATGAEAAS